jgi:dCMP deaminase
MADQKQLDETYMGTAMLHARLSKAIRAQVGAVLVTSQGVTLTGYNGTPTGLSNACEVFQTVHDSVPVYVTKPEVIHAELNCILKAAREGVSCVGATMYVTLSPCVPCAAMMIQAGVKRLVFKDLYRDQGGIGLLLDAQVMVECYDYTQSNERK